MSMPMTPKPENTDLKPETMKYNEQEYLNDVELELNKGFVEGVCNVINDWAESIPHNPYPDLGDGIRIERAVRLMMYRSDLRTQYDARRVEELSAPYRSQPLPPLKYEGPSQIDAWRFALPRPDGYGESEANYLVTGSQHVEKCTSCKGTGLSECPSCHGGMSQPCNTCHGSGRVQNYTRCSKCSGTGQVVGYETQRVVTGYDGARTLTKKATVRVMKQCPMCGGKGTIKAGMVDCYTCSGLGKVPCSTCSGHGFVTCSVCDGFRQLYYYSQIARRLRSASWCRYNVDIPDDDFVLLRDIVAESDYTLVDRFGSDSGPVGDDLSVLPHVGRTVSGMVSRAHAAAKEGERILFEEVEVRRTPVYRIDYHFCGERYTLYITESDKVSAARSPITGYAENLRARTISQVRRRNLYDADRNAERLYYLSGKNEAFWDLAVEIAYKMRSDMSYGGHLALVILSVLALPLYIWYFGSVSYVAPWVDLEGMTGSWLWPFVPWLYLLAALWGSYRILHLKWWFLHEKLPSMFLRIGAGACIAALALGVLTLALGLLHWLVLPAMLETAGDIVALPWRVVSGIWNFIF